MKWKKLSALLLVLCLIVTQVLSIVVFADDENNAEQDHELYSTLRGKILLRERTTPYPYDEYTAVVGYNLSIKVMKGEEVVTESNTDHEGKFAVEILNSILTENATFYIEVTDHGYPKGYRSDVTQITAEQIRSGEEVTVWIERGGYLNVSIPIDHFPAVHKKNGEIAVLDYIDYEGDGNFQLSNSYFMYESSVAGGMSSWTIPFIQTGDHKFAFSYYSKDDFNTFGSQTVYKNGIFQYFDNIGAADFENAIVVSIQKTVETKLPMGIDIATHSWIGDRAHNPAADVTAPTASVREPAGENVPLSGDATIDFSEPIDISAGENAGSVRFLHKDGDIDLSLQSARWEDDNKILNLAYSNLVPGRFYLVEVSKFKDLAGNEMSLNKESSFVADSGHIQRSLIDSVTNISIQGQITPDAEIEAIEGSIHPKGTCKACDAIHSSMGKELLLSLHGIHVRKGNFTGKITVAIPIDPKYNGQNVSVLHCKDGELETIPLLVEDGKVFFTLDSLSPVAVALPESNSSNPNDNPSQGGGGNSGSNSGNNNSGSNNSGLSGSSNQYSPSSVRPTNSEMIRDEKTPLSNIDLVDVNASRWYFYDVYFAYENSLIAPTKENSFDPQGSTTYATVAGALLQLNNLPASQSNILILKKETELWYIDAVEWMVDNKILGSSSEKIDLYATLSREQIASILYRYATLKGYSNVASDLSQFRDKNKISAQNLEAVQWAVGNGIIGGKSNHLLDPSGRATRAEFAAMLHRLVKKIM